MADRAGYPMERMRIEADLLAEGYEPDEISLLAVVDRGLRRLINQSVDFELVASNIDRPNADDKYDPRWYTAQGIKTGLHEALYGVLHDLLACDVASTDGHTCYLGLQHTGWHADGNGTSWGDDRAPIQ